MHASFRKKIQIGAQGKIIRILFGVDKYSMPYARVFFLKVCNILIVTFVIFENCSFFLYRNSKHSGILFSVFWNRQIKIFKTFHALVRKIQAFEIFINKCFYVFNDNAFQIWIAMCVHTRIKIIWGQILNIHTYVNNCLIIHFEKSHFSGKVCYRNTIQKFVSTANLAVKFYNKLRHTHTHIHTYWRLNRQFRIVAKIGESLLRIGNDNPYKEFQHEIDCHWVQ